MQYLQHSDFSCCLNVLILLMTDTIIDTTCSTISLRICILLSFVSNSSFSLAPLESSRQLLSISYILALLYASLILVYCNSMKFTYSFSLSSLQYLYLVAFSFCLNGKDLSLSSSFITICSPLEQSSYDDIMFSMLSAACCTLKLLAIAYLFMSFAMLSIFDLQQSSFLISKSSVKILVDIS